jgi:hypothetical protein
MGKKSPKELSTEEFKAKLCAPAIPNATPTLKQQNEVKGKFVKVPVEWIAQLLSVDADRSTWLLAIYLLHEAWRSRRDSVKVTNIALKKWGVSRFRKRHALDQLGALSLVSEEHRGRKSPVVKVKFTD